MEIDESVETNDGLIEGSFDPPIDSLTMSRKRRRAENDNKIKQQCSKCNIPGCKGRSLQQRCLSIPEGLRGT